MVVGEFSPGLPRQPLSRRRLRMEKLNLWVMEPDSPVPLLASLGLQLAASSLHNSRASINRLNSL